MRHNINLKTDHFQFYLANEGCDVDTSEIWNPTTSHQRFALEDCLLSVGTVRYGGQTKIVVDVLDEPPKYDFDDADHIVTGSLRLDAGMLGIYAPETDEDNVVWIELAAGTYQFLVLYKNGDTVQDEMDAEGNDEYHVLLWLGVYQEAAVLKQHGA
jgi:hypothetical protein